MAKRLLLMLAMCAPIFFALYALTLVKPRQKALGQRAAAQATVNAFTNNAGARRAGARTLKADSDTSLKVGDINTAMDERLQMLDFDKPKVTNLGALSFYAIQVLALDDIGRIASRLDAPAARRYADELERRDAKLFTHAQILGNQKAEELKLVDDLAKDPGDWSVIAKELGFTPQEQSALKSLTFAQVKSNISAFYDKAIASSKLSYSPTRARPAMALDPYTKNYATAYVADRFLWTRAKTQRVLTVAALRARADHLEGKAATAPLPADPFGTGPLQSKGGIVYSVGPDAIDNGGRLVPTPYRAGAKGDILMPKF